MTGYEITICAFIISFPEANKQHSALDSEQNLHLKQDVLRTYQWVFHGFCISKHPCINKAHLFHFWKLDFFSPRLSISRHVNFIEIAFTEAKCWLDGPRGMAVTALAMLEVSWDISLLLKFPWRVIGKNPNCPIVFVTWIFWHCNL